jgi:hypothetical protein
MKNTPWQRLMVLLGMAIAKRREDSLKGKLKDKAKEEGSRISWETEDEVL